MSAIGKIGVLSLALLITGSVDSVRNMPTSALFGPQLLFFAVLGAIFFLIPIGLVSAEMVTTEGMHGGLYVWVKRALGRRAAFLAVWLQWINTLVWYPTILSFIAGSAAYLIDPALAQNKAYLVSVVLTVFWGLALVNLRGLKAAAMVASFCTFFGMVLPMLLIIVLGLYWAFKGLPMQVHMPELMKIPDLRHFDAWISLTAIITSFLGMELATVHARDIDNPQKNFPRALLFSVIFILGTTVLGSLVIAWVLPQHDIHLVDGTMQVFTRFFQEYHMMWFLPVLAVALVIGSIGGMINWVISPTRGLLQAAEDGFLPRYFCKVNRHGAPSNLIIIQAVLVSLMCLAFVLMPSVNGSYWLLTDLSTQLYVMMYVLLFISAWVFKIKHPQVPAGFRVSKNSRGTGIACFTGLLGCLSALMVGFVPPSDIDVGGAMHFFIIFTFGLIMMLLPVLGFYQFERHKGGALDDEDLAIGNVG